MNQKKDLEVILKKGAQKPLQQAIEQEVADYIERHQHELDNTKKRLVVRNGKMPQRCLTTGIAPITIQQPRVFDRRPNEKRWVR